MFRLTYDIHFSKTLQPIVEEVIPSFQHNLKFLNVDATVYRHTLDQGSLPKIKVLRYSSSPLINVDTSTKEVLVSTVESDCLELSGVPMKKFQSGISLYTTTALTLALTLGSGSGALSAFALLLGSSVWYKGGFAYAAETSCTPSMEIVIEAPPYYLGSVAECLAEVENPDHCPTDFPTYPTCSDHNPSCALVVVGAGTGGLYTAMRLVDENKVDGADVCVFEATERVGGRLYSLRGFGPNNKITVDAGGYRTWPEYTVSCYHNESNCVKKIL